jgi:hypothetical protein
MHIHTNQTNPYAALDALRSAEKTASRREAAQTRKKLTQASSELAGEVGEAVVLDLEARNNNKDKRQPAANKNQRHQSKMPVPEASADAENPDAHISDWA